MRAVNLGCRAVGPDLVHQAQQLGFQSGRKVHAQRPVGVFDQAIGRSLPIGLGHQRAVGGDELPAHVVRHLRLQYTLLQLPGNALKLLLIVHVQRGEPGVDRVAVALPGWPAVRFGEPAAPH